MVIHKNLTNTTFSQKYLKISSNLPTTVRVGGRKVSVESLSVRTIVYKGKRTPCKTFGYVTVTHEHHY